MEFLELAKERCSVRKYAAKKVEEEKLLKILEAGRVAPTAANFQPQRIIVVQKSEGLEKVGRCTRLYNAPLALIVCGDHNVSWKRSADKKDYLDVDVTIITDHMMLQAAELGLGSVWIGAFNKDLLKSEFNIPENIEPVNILAVGYPEGETASPDRHDKARKALDEIVHYDTY